MVGSTIKKVWLLVALSVLHNAASAISVNSYGIVSGDPNAATQNTKKIRDLLSPEGTNPYVGIVTFPDAKTYYFNDVILIRDGIHIDLMGSTLSFSKLPDA